MFNQHAIISLYDILQDSKIKKHILEIIKLTSNGLSHFNVEKINKFKLELEQIKIGFFSHDSRLNYKTYTEEENVSKDQVALPLFQMFFALVLQKDGHDYIESAYKNGFNIFVVQKDIDYSFFVNDLQNKNQNKGNKENSSEGNILLFIKTDDTLEFYKLLASFLRKYRNLIVISITGSNGKTTIKEMVYHFLGNILHNFSLVSKTYTNFNNEIGVSFSLLNTGRSVKYKIMELGMNHKGEISQLAQIVKPNIGIITNITDAHLGFFKSKNDILLAKAELFEYLISNDGYLIINMEDSLLAKWFNINVDRLNHDKVFLFTIKEFKSQFQNLYDYIIKLPIADYNKFNFMFSIWIVYVISKIYNIEFYPNIIKNAILYFKFPKLRSSWVFYTRALFDYLFYVDCYNASITSMEKALSFFNNLQIDSNFLDSMFKFGNDKITKRHYDFVNKIAILGDILELGTISKQKHEGLVEFIKKQESINYFIFIGENMYYTFKKLQQDSVYKNRVFWFESVDIFLTTHKSIFDFIKEILYLNDENLIEDNNILNLILLKASRKIQLERLLDS